MENPDWKDEFRKKFVAQIEGEHDMVAFKDSEDGTLDYWNAYTLELFFENVLETERQKYYKRGFEEARKVGWQEGGDAARTVALNVLDNK
jgi:hypothetical protein